VVIIVLAWVAGRRGWVGVGAAAIVALLGVVGIIAGLMEPALRTLDPLVTPIAVLSAARVALGATRNSSSTA
jgi:hypothetical protein